jgi:hypothetical protein
LLSHLLTNYRADYHPLAYTSKSDRYFDDDWSDHTNASNSRAGRRLSIFSQVSFVCSCLEYYGSTAVKMYKQELQWCFDEDWPMCISASNDLADGRLSISSSVSLVCFRLQYCGQATRRFYVVQVVSTKGAEKWGRLHAVARDT